MLSYGKHFYRSVVTLSVKGYSITLWLGYTNMRMQLYVTTPNNHWWIKVRG